MELYYLSAYATTSASYDHGGDDAEYKKELYYLSAYATTSASYAHGGDDAEYKKEFRM